MYRSIIVVNMAHIVCVCDFDRYKNSYIFAPNEAGDGCFDRWYY